MATVEELRALAGPSSPSAGGAGAAPRPAAPTAPRAASVEELRALAHRSPLDRAGDYISGLGETIQQGFSLGLKDEVSALGGAVGTYIGETIQGRPVDFGATYDKELAQARQPAREFREQHPTSAFVGELGGGLVAGAPKAVVGGVTFLRNMFSAGGLGAVSGAGFSEGDFADRAVGAAGGFGLGAGLTAVTTPIIRGLSNLGQRALTKTERTALNDIMRAFERDGVSVDDAMQRLQQWRSSGAKPEVLADLGGDNVRGLLRGAVSTPSQARTIAEKTLTPRQLQQSDRVYGDALAALAPGANTRQAAVRLARFRAAGSELLYDTAYVTPLRAKGAQYTTSDLLKILNRPTMKRALATAERQAKDLGKSLPRITDGKGNVTRLPDMEMLDWIKKQGLDSVIEKFRDPVTGRLSTKDPEVRTLLALKDQYLSVLDDLSPAYKSARNAFSGPSEALSAIELGRGFLGNFRRNPAVAEKALKKMTEGEKEFFRVGVAQSIQDLLENAPDGANAVRRIFGTPRLREGMRLLMPNEEALARFEAAIERETNMFRTNRIAGFESGSPTARIAEEIADMASDIGITPGNILSEVVRSPRETAARLLASLSKDSKQAFKADVADALGKILMSGSPEEIARLLVRLQGVSRATANTQAAEGLAGRASGMFGGQTAAAPSRNR